MKKYIFIVNGKPGSGKTTFFRILNEISNGKVYSRSSIDYIKEMAKEYCGCDPELKTNRNRNLLATLKGLLKEYNDIPFKDLKKHVDIFAKSPDHTIMLIDIREPEEIIRACHEFGAESIFIERDVYLKPSNSSDEVSKHDIDYDHIIKNTDDIESFYKCVSDFYIFKILRNN